MKAIVIAFTLKGQDSTKIIHKIAELGLRYAPVILIHGFMPRAEVEKKGWDLNIVDALDDNFPIQLNMYDVKRGGVLRDEMAEVAKQMKAEVFGIGDIVSGVAEEWDKYYKAGLVMEHIPL